VIVGNNIVRDTDCDDDDDDDAGGDGAASEARDDRTSTPMPLSVQGMPDAGQ